jgi:ABC-type nickel/cobalt efflux system permease component RcnA
MKKPASLVAAIVFWLIALAQVVRVILRVRVTAGSHDIPLWLSSVAFVVLGTLGLWLWRERQETR